MCVSSFSISPFLTSSACFVCSQPTVASPSIHKAVFLLMEAFKCLKMLMAKNCSKDREVLHLHACHKCLGLWCECYSAEEPSRPWDCWESEFSRPSRHSVKLRCSVSAFECYVLVVWQRIFQCCPFESFWCFWFVGFFLVFIFFSLWFLLLLLVCLGFFFFAFSNGNSGNESSGHSWFFCFEFHPWLLDMTAFLVFLLLNSAVSSSVGLSDLLSFENW